MNLLIERTLEQLAGEVPAAMPIPTLTQRLHEARTSVTESVLTRTLQAAPGLRIVDPWIGPNQACPRPDDLDGAWAIHAPPSGPLESRELPDAPAPALLRPVTTGALDRTLRTVGARTDDGSPAALARWVRLVDEAQSAAERTSRYCTPGPDTEGQPARGHLRLV